jgi:hypothetical protein
MDNLLKINPYKTIFKWIVENGVSNYKPYHNLRHLLTVFKNCVEGATIENLPRDSREPLFIAALLHDLDHAGASDDQINISITIDSIYEMQERLKLPISDKEFNLILDYIRATKYPYEYPSNNNLLLSHKIIRDADLMGVYEENYLPDIFLGLFEELPIETIEEFIPQNDKFINSIFWHTSWARNKWQLHKGNIQIKLKNINQVFE